VSSIVWFTLCRVMLFTVVVCQYQIDSMLCGPPWILEFALDDRPYFKSSCVLAHPAVSSKEGGAWHHVQECSDYLP
jgi:hypothetical protein